MEKYDYIKYFESTIDICIKEVEMIKYLMENLNNINVKEFFTSIKDITRNADKQEFEMIYYLNKEFIPIFEREDVLQLSNLLHKVILKIEKIAKNIRVFNVKKINIVYLNMLEILIEAVYELKNIIRRLEVIKVIDDISEYTQKIKEIESKADDICINALSELYEVKGNIYELIESRDIIQSFEEAINACEDVAFYIDIVQINNR